MDSNVFTYQMKRKDFGKPTHLMDSKKVYELALWPNPTWDKDNRFLTDNPNEKRNPNFIDLSNIPEYSENTVNTERVNMDTKKMFHYEGGWPNEVDITEEKSRHNHVRKRLERNMVGTDVFIDSCRVMTKKVKDVIKMNNQIDMYEEYFDGEAPDHNIEKLSVKTSMLFKDPEKDVKRSINKISWHPDGPHKLVGAYCLMRFQNQPLDISRKVDSSLRSHTSGISRIRTLLSTRSSPLRPSCLWPTTIRTLMRSRSAATTVEWAGSTPSSTPRSQATTCPVSSFHITNQLWTSSGCPANSTMSSSPAPLMDRSAGGTTVRWRSQPTAPTSANTTRARLKKDFLPRLLEEPVWSSSRTTDQSTFWELRRAAS